MTTECIASPAIQIEHLFFKIGNRYLLEDINWTIQSGEKWVVYGMNGSGKTTLLSCIAGVQHYDSGLLKIFGESYTEQNYSMLKRRIGFVSGSFFDNHYHKETVLDIVLSGKYGYLGLSYDITLEDVFRAKELLKAFHLTDFTYRSFHTLSKGERQNVMIARALMSDPEILLLDEPCSGLDIYNRAYLFRIIDLLSSKLNITIIYVTHYLEEIANLYTDCLMMKNGKVYAQGSIDETLTGENISGLLHYPVQLQKLSNAGYQLTMAKEQDLDTQLTRLERLLCK